MDWTFDRSVPGEIQEAIENIRSTAKDEGLDFFETIFEMVDYDKINELAAYGGFPNRYPHWRFGMEYERLKKGSTYGLSQIYEMVINNDPAYAYLLRGNSLTQQKVIIAHVYGHVDFFKNNFYFSKTNRSMVDEMANHGTRVRKHMNEVGRGEVEDFIDTCLSLENLIDPFKDFIERTPDVDEEELEDGEIPKLASKDYMDEYINPPEYLEEQRERIEEERERLKDLPPEPVRDVLMFLLDHAPLEKWEADVLSIIREEAYYFAPQKQTKIMNEGWACVGADTSVFTGRGLIPMQEVVEEEVGFVSDGWEGREVYDYNVIEDVETITIRTDYGFELTGSKNHRVMHPDGVWFRLDELQEGDNVLLRGCSGVWPEENVNITWVMDENKNLEQVAQDAGVSLSTVIRHRNGRDVNASKRIDEALEDYDSEDKRLTKQRKKIQIPKEVNVEFARFLGYLVGDGHISRVKRQLGLTTADDAQAEDFEWLVQKLFGLDVEKKWDDGRWRVLVYSETLSDFLVDGLGLTYGPSARHKTVPDVILRSPKKVVASFIGGLFDADGYAGESGVILSTSSDEMAEKIQLLLLNFGIMARRRRQKDGCWHVRLTSHQAKTYREEIGFNLNRKSEALSDYLEDRDRFDPIQPDEIVEIEKGRSDVYDISVKGTHRYAAAGFVNHNSFWHSELSMQVLDDSEIVDYADMNSQVLKSSPQKMNPYKLGVELFRHIEDRWNKGRFGREWDELDSLEARKHYDRELGLGRDKIFDVRRVHNDVTFIDEFLTPEFVRDQQMYAFGYDDNRDGWFIDTREFNEIKNRLLDQRANLGNPVIYVVDGNYENRGELLLKHKYEGEELRQDYAKKVLESLERVWKRPVNLSTVKDGEGLLMNFDGSGHSEDPHEYEPV